MNAKKTRNNKRLTKVGRIASEKELWRVGLARKNAEMGNNYPTLIKSWLSADVANIYLRPHKHTQAIITKPAGLR